MRPKTDSPSSRGSVDDGQVLHTWRGVVGPRPTILSFISCALVAAIFAHLIIDLPSWWPFAVGAVAIGFNVAVAYWQAGSVRVVAVTGNGIQVLRKARWSSRCTHLMGTMPRMPLGPFTGRWCRASVANSSIWVHRSHHAVIAAYDAECRDRFRVVGLGHPTPAGDHRSPPGPASALGSGSTSR